MFFVLDINTALLVVLEIFHNFIPAIIVRRVN